MLVRREGKIPRESLDPHAVTVVERLQKHGHEAYLVGGCVRDLLGGIEPKDFDVATDAHPGRIRRVFRNARIIGRRFRLAHIHFGPDHIIEASTFRGPPDLADDPENPENFFGTAPQDAERRDFTMNALFYDPSNDEILDYVGGLEDIEKGVVRAIGDPDVRLAEDPVRIVRAVHHAERLGFELEESLDAAIRAQAPKLEDASQARLYIELLKVLGRGHAYKALHKLHDQGALQYWTPEVENSHDMWLLLGAADRWGPSAHGADESLRLAPLVASWVVDQWKDTGRRGYPAWSGIFDDTVRPMCRRMSLPRRTMSRVKEFLWLWLQMQNPPQGKRSLKMARHPGFGHALTFLRLDLDARDESSELADQWQQFAEEHDVPTDRTPPTRPQPRRSRGGRRGGRGGRGRRGEGRRSRDIRSEADAWAPAPDLESDA